MSDHDPAREAAWDALLEWTRARHRAAWEGPVGLERQTRVDAIRAEVSAFCKAHPEHAPNLPRIP